MHTELAAYKNERSKDIKRKGSKHWLWSILVYIIFICLCIVRRRYLGISKIGFHSGAGPGGVHKKIFTSEIRVKLFV